MAGGASWAEAWGPGVEAGPANGSGTKGEGSDGSRGCGAGFRFAGANWRPWEIVATIVGFAIFWPIGLAFVAWKIWGAKAMCKHGNHARWSRHEWRHRRHDGLRRDTGNMAFDEYKAAELERLEKERQRLADEQKAFGEFLNDLKRAKDREEFDRFMASRGSVIDNGEGAPA